MKKYTFNRIAGDKKQIEQIKQIILDLCTEFKCTQEIAEETGIPPNIILSHCKRMATYRFLEVKETVSHRGAKKYYFKTLKPVYKEIRINQAAETECKTFKWNPIAWMGMQPIEHKATGRVFKIDERSDASDYVKHLKKADEERRKEAKKQVTKGVYVSGSTLHMAV